MSPLRRWRCLLYVGGCLTGLSLIAGSVVGFLELERQVAGVVILATMIINIGFFLFPVF